MSDERKAKWTPGPWVEERGYIVTETLRDNPDGVYHVAVATIQDWRGCESEDERNANARLIAKAPDMAALLERYIGLDLCQCKRQAEECEVCSEARALLAEIEEK